MAKAAQDAHHWVHTYVSVYRLVDRREEVAYVDTIITFLINLTIMMAMRQK